MAWLQAIAGIFLLYVGAELLVRTTVKLSHLFSVRRPILALTIAAFAISLPLSIYLLFWNRMWIESNNFLLKISLGSGCIHFGLALGIYLLLAPCKISFEMKWHKYPQLFFVYLLLFFVMIGGKISKAEGTYLFLMLIFYNFLQYFFPKQHKEKKEQPLVKSKITVEIFAYLFSVAALVFGLKFFLDGLNLADNFLIITTSLPTLALALVCFFRKREEIFLETMIGSNIFTPLLTISFAAMFHPLYDFEQSLLIHFPVLIGFTLILWFFMLRAKGQIFRFEGIILLLSYALYAVIFFLL